MKCQHCGKEIKDDAQFCRYCGKPINENLVTEDTKAVSKKKWVFIAIGIVVLVAAAAVYFTQLYEKEELSDAVKSISLKDSYALEDDTIVLEYPTAKYTDGTDGKIKKYTAYVNGKACKVRKGKVTLPKDVSPGKCTLRLEWKKNGTTEYCEKTIKVEEPSKGKPEKTPVVNEVGNTISRISSLGYFTQQGEWFFLL